MSQALRSSLLGAALALVIMAGFAFFAVDIAQSQVPTDPPIDPAPGDVQTDRLGGETRFETSVSISQEAFPEGAVDVFLARADDFADALSGSSLTTTGPILLVPQCDDIPQVVLDEIERLAPERVAALGGDAAVCEAVLQEAATAAAAGGPSGSESPSEVPTSTETPTASPSPSEACTEGPLGIPPCPDPSETPTDDPTDPVS